LGCALAAVVAVVAVAASAAWTCGAGGRTAALLGCGLAWTGADEMGGIGARGEMGTTGRASAWAT
jgi:hypothetical protein